MRVLLVGDSDPGRRSCRRMLARARSTRFELEEANSIAAAVAALAERGPDLLLVDDVLPDGSGVDLLEHLDNARDWEYGLAPPALMLIGKDAEGVAVRALEAGAIDCLVKEDIDDVTLVSALLEAAAAAERQREQRRRALLLERLAITDELSGCYNRRHLLYRLREEYHRASRYGVALSVARLDIDHFERIHDDFGHPMGDRVIRRLGALLGEELRTLDIIGRYGGEAFAAVLTHTPLDAATRVAERMRQRFAARRFATGGDDAPALTCTLSAGVAAFETDLDSVEALLARAEQALHAARRAGRNSVYCWLDGAVRRVPEGQLPAAAASD